MNTSRFTGKVAIVTGSGRGMVKATALMLASDGATVLVNDVSREFAETTVKEIETAVLDLSCYAACEVAPYNINAVAPGGMDTEMVRELATPEHMEQERQNITLRRLGTAQDEANLLVFLCSEESSYITGATIDINSWGLMI